MSLVEVLLASSLLLVLLTAVMVTMNVAETVNTNVNAQYQEFDQAVPALAPLQTLLRAEVEPAPASGSGVPVPGFGLREPLSVGNFSLTFYSNIGTAYNNVTTAGTTAGPAKIVAQEVVTANGSPSPRPPSAPPPVCADFQVSEYLPVTNGGVSTCPGVSPSGTACQYPTTGKLLVNVIGVVNNPSQGSTAPPIFTYNVLDPRRGPPPISPTPPSRPD